MIDFTSVANALVDAPCAWLAEEQLAAALGCAEAELTIAIDGLVAGRLIDRWARPDGPVVILTALGAKQLGVRLVEVPGAQLYRWSAEAASVRSTKPSRRAVERTEAHDAALRQTSDAQRPSHLRVSRPLPRRDPPAPRVLLLGHGLVPWDEDRSADRPDVRCSACRPRKRKRSGAAAIVVAACRRCGLGLRRRPKLEHCPGCGGRKLPATWYCLRCDRWGLDGYFSRRGFRKTRRKAG